MQRALLSCLVCLVLCLWAVSPAQARMTLLMPDDPVQDLAVGDNRSKKAPKTGDAETAAPQMDVLLALMDPTGPQGLEMDMPQMFAVLRWYADPVSGDERPALKAHREDLLGDLEEIRYLDKKAWAVNVSLKPAGLYQLIAEGRPWWDAEQDLFRQHFVKTLVPVSGRAEGWALPAGLKFEIVPLTRPFGLVTPSLFTGRVLLSGQPQPDAPVRIARFNTDRASFASPWQKEYEVRTAPDGTFSFVCPLPGWWGFQALAEGDALKGPDGQPRTLEMGAVLWIWVDAPRAAKSKGRGR